MNPERYQDHIDSAADELPDDLGAELICCAEDLQHRAERRQRAMALVSYRRLPWRARGYASVLLIEAKTRPPAVYIDGFSLLPHHGAGNA